MPVVWVWMDGPSPWGFTVPVDRLVMFSDVSSWMPCFPIRLSRSTVVLGSGMDPLLPGTNTAGSHGFPGSSCGSFLVLIWGLVVANCQSVILLGSTLVSSVPGLCDGLAWCHTWTVLHLLCWFLRSSSSSGVGANSLLATYLIPIP